MKHLINKVNGEIIPVQDKDAQALVDTGKYSITSKSRYKAFVKNEAKITEKIEKARIKREAEYLK